MFDGTEVELKRGQFITGRKSLAKSLRTTEQKIRSRIALLEKHNQIVVKSTNKYTIITVVKYDHYQDDPKKITNRQPTDNQQITTNNKDNKGKKELTANAEEKLPTNKLDNMKWNDKGDDYLESDVQIDPDFQPVKKKEEKASAEIQQVFDLFNNPARHVWRLRKIERESAKVLLETYGMETLKKRMERIELEQKKGDPLFPLVVSPSQLLEKMPNVERYLGI